MQELEALQRITAFSLSSDDFLLAMDKKVVKNSTFKRSS